MLRIRIEIGAEQREISRLRADSRVLTAERRAIPAVLNTIAFRFGRVRSKSVTESIHTKFAGIPVSDWRQP